MSATQSPLMNGAQWFRPELWPANQPFWGGPFRPPADRPVQPQDVKEVWFTGVHGDIGGGYPEKQSALIKLPLAWMIRETKAMGLDYSTRTVNEVVLGKNPEKDYVAPNAMAEPHDSMNLAWRLVEFIPRKVPPSSWRHDGKAGGIYLPKSDPRLISEDALVHISVEERLNGSPDGSRYKPRNLPLRYRIER